MYARFLTFLVFYLISSQLQAQLVNTLRWKADSSYNTKSFAVAAPFYVQAGEVAEFPFQRKRVYYDAGCCYALLGQIDLAFKYLTLVVKTYGYDNLANIEKDADLKALHTDKRWLPLLNSIKPNPIYTDDPRKARLITTDVHNFWEAYNQVLKDTSRRMQIYRDQYLARATPGLQDYYEYKIRTLAKFVKSQEKLPKFYASLRPNTLKVEAQKPQMIDSFIKFKELYPAAKFPNVYFVIGSFSSGGTSTSNGLIIGLDQNCRTPAVPTDELTLWQKNNFSNLSELPHIVAHELIHFQQGSLANDTTLLRAALVEGMADFLGELISGKTANSRLGVYAKGREKQIWADFKKEMYLNRASNWIANSAQETADKPADLGYWVGYLICKAYYDEAADKKQAVYDMLNIKDYRQFLERSRVEEKIECL
ncbi:hypothetical protein EXU85_00930 [Spirosoma sp. KCTC 42546]|uniref:gliding motility protein GldB-related protein n=1 Tax=Spirosoma sp. KCTC 42546 TaxID=2520506 RepID=UPI00115A01C8|nr:DUF2268 domain-containing putative Zn-dependent protease [Spirosoma sp. KCTC 42546]QDK77231.1 hypothetical protein EXU85_00930 [Spirosoma sp. KCTC 42546]